MFKNVASQKITLLAIDTASNIPKTGDSANITAYVSKDDGAVTVLGDTTATELDATNAPGLYSFDLTQAETNADKLVFSAKSSTSGVKIVPVLIYTFPTTGILAPTVSGRTLDVSAGGEAGVDWANVGSPTTTLNLSGTTVKTLTDAPSDSSGTTTLLSRLSSARAGYLDNINNANLSSVPAFPTNFAALAITVGGAVTAGTVSDKTGYSLTQSFPNNFASLGINASGHITRVTLCDTITTYTGDTPQTGDSYARIGATGSGLTSLAPAATALSTATWTTARAGYLDSVILAANANQRTVSVTGSQHIAADVHEFQAGVITAGDFGTDAIAAACVSAGAANKIADHVRRRTQANVEASSDGDALSLLSLYGFIQQAQESAASGGTLTVKKTDGTTTLGTRTLASSASADPITGVS